MKNEDIGLLTDVVMTFAVVANLILFGRAVAAVVNRRLKLVYSSEKRGMSQEDYNRHMSHLMWFSGGFMTCLVVTMWMVG